MSWVPWEYECLNFQCFRELEPSLTGVCCGVGAVTYQGLSRSWSHHLPGFVAELEPSLTRVCRGAGAITYQGLSRSWSHHLPGFADELEPSLTRVCRGAGAVTHQGFGAKGGAVTRKPGSRSATLLYTGFDGHVYD